jgi:flagellar motor switch protein FliN/FliY
VTAELGRVRMPIRQVLELREGSVVSLRKNAGEPVNLYVNEQLIAKGDVVVVDDFMGIRITEVVTGVL